MITLLLLILIVIIIIYYKQKSKFVNDLSLRNCAYAKDTKSVYACLSQVYAQEQDNDAGEIPYTQDELFQFYKHAYNGDKELFRDNCVKKLNKKICEEFLRKFI